MSRNHPAGRGGSGRVAPGRRILPRGSAFGRRTPGAPRSARIPDSVLGAVGRQLLDYSGAHPRPDLPSRLSMTRPLRNALGLALLLLIAAMPARAQAQADAQEKQIQWLDWDTGMALAQRNGRTVLVDDDNVVCGRF